MIEQLSVGDASLYLTQVERGISPLRDNYGLHVGDDATLVLERRHALAKHIGRPIVWMDQTHSADVALVRHDGGNTPEVRSRVQVTLGQTDSFLSERDPHLWPQLPCDGAADVALVRHDGGNTPEVRSRVQVTLGQTDSFLSERDPHLWPQLPCDGVVVDARSWPQAPAVAVMTADCMPIIFSADKGRVVAGIHAGRIGFTTGIILHTLEIFASLGLSAREISVYIAPAICGQCYEVPVEMQRELSQLMPKIAGATRWGTPSLDLPKAAAAQLHAAGCEHVTIDARCTLEDQQWHSHRRDPRSGRHVSLVVPTWENA